MASEQATKLTKDAGEDALSKAQMKQIQIKIKKG